MKNLLLIKVLVLGVFLGLFSSASAVDFKKGSYIDYKIPQDIRVEAGLPDDFPDNVKIEFEVNMGKEDSDVARLGLDMSTAFTAVTNGYWFMLSVDQKNGMILYYNLHISRLSDDETIFGKDGSIKQSVSDIAGYIH